MLGQHRGDSGVEVGRVVQILDIGAVHSEDVVDSDCREVFDDVVDHPVLSWHAVNTTGERLKFTEVHRRLRIYSDRCSRTWPVSAETTCTAAIWLIGVEMLPAGVAV